MSAKASPAKASRTGPTRGPIRGLGRGLDALFPQTPDPSPPKKQTVQTPPPPEAPAVTPAPPASLPHRTSSSNAFRCAIEAMAPMPGQPRQHFDAEKLAELVTSIKNHGLIEPLIVRKAPPLGAEKRATGKGTAEYEIIAGERRWRAAQQAGLHEVLVVLHEASSPEAFELALIENAQREDLNAIEFAEALERLIEERAYTQDALASRLGKSRSAVSNALRLLKLPRSVRSKVAQQELSEGHARALLGLPNAHDKTVELERLAAKVVAKRLNVRQTEALVRRAKANAENPSPPVPTTKSPGVRDLEHRLTRQLGTRCEVNDRKGKGELRIHYSSLDELDRLIEALL